MNKLKTKIYIWWLKLRIQRKLIIIGMAEPVLVRAIAKISLLWSGLLFKFGATPRQRLSRITHAIMAFVIIVSILPSFIFSGLFQGSAEAASFSQGPRYATATGDCVNDASIGTIAWTNPGNAFSSNNSPATATLGTATTNYIKCTNFGFSIPAGVTIAGITVAFERTASATNRIYDSRISIVKGGTISTTNRASGTAWAGTETTVNYGSISDLWGETWSVSDINATNFGAVIAATRSAGGTTTASVDSVAITVQYSFNPTFDQSGYRWFNNQDSSTAIDVGSALGGVAQNTTATALGDQQIIRLRMTLHVGTDPAPANSGLAFKLQYAQRGTDNLCDTSFSTETYADITTTSPIAFANNTLATDGQSVLTNSGDPTHSGHTIINQEYNEANNTGVTNYIAAGQDGMWDFALKDNAAPASTNFCFRLVYDSGTVLSTYSVIPQLLTMPPDFKQANYRWYKGQDAVPNNTFVQSWGGTGNDRAFDIIQTSDGGYVVTGDTYSYGQGASDMFITKYDSSGAVSWNKTWGGAGTDAGKAVIQSTDGGYIVTGNIGSSMAVVKYDSSGAIEWNKAIGGFTGANYGQDIVQTNDGGYAAVGYTSEYGVGSNDIILVKLSNTGKISWSKTWGGTGNDVGNALVQAVDDSYIITGTTESYGAGSSDAVLMKLDNKGTLIWSKTWGGIAADTGNSLVVTNNSSYIITGSTNNFGAVGADTFLAKFEDSGTLSWSKTWGGTGNEYNSHIAQAADGNYVISGDTRSFGAGLEDVYLSKYDASGTLLWDKTWGTSVAETSSNVAITTDGGYAAVGNGVVTGGGGLSDAIVFKYDYYGNFNSCQTPMCQDPSATVGSPTVVLGSPSPTLGTPMLTNAAPTITATSPTATVTAIVGHLTFTSMTDICNFNCAPKSIFQESDSDYVLGGKFNEGFGIVRYDSVGRAITKTAIGDYSGYSGYNMVATEDGGYVMVGDYDTGTNSYFFSCIAKFSSTGTVVWKRDFQIGSGNSRTNDIKKTSDGGFIITGTAWAGANNYDMFLAKFDSSGNYIWHATWGGPSDDSGSSPNVVIAPDGGYVMAGSSADFGVGGSDLCFIKFNSSGALIGQISYGGSGTDSVKDIINTSDDGYMVTGLTASFGAGGGDVFIAKFDSMFSLSWVKTWGGTGNESAATIIQTDDGGYALTGITYSFGSPAPPSTSNYEDAIIIKYNPYGDVEWDRVIGRPWGNDASGIIQTSDGGYAIATESSLDWMIHKFDSNGHISGCGGEWVCVVPNGSTSSQAFTLNNISGTSGAQTYTAKNDTAVTGPVAPTYATTYVAQKTVWGVNKNLPSIPIGNQDNAGVSTRHDDPIRLRFTLENVKTASLGSSSLKLQVAPKVGTCDVAFTGESYSDLSGSTMFNYYNNTNLASNEWVHAGVFDPSVGASTLWYENYQEAGGFTNRHHIKSAQFGLWDISLTPTDDAVYSSYCFRVVHNDNSLLNGYTRVFELNIPPAASQQMRHGKFFDTTGVKQPFYW